MPHPLPQPLPQPHPMPQPLPHLLPHPMPQPMPHLLPQDFSSMNLSPNQYIWHLVGQPRQFFQSCHFQFFYIL
jgi:hypothetical protein